MTAERLEEQGRGYFHRNARANQSHAYLLPELDAVILQRGLAGKRAIDIGCGNGYVSEHIRRKGLAVLGLDPSESGIKIARESYPEIEFHQASGYDSLKDRFGQFDLVVCFEVIEHLYSPAILVRNLASLTCSGGVCVVSTPYHGYVKNLALALSGRLPKHFNPLREGGHIKFFSSMQMQALLEHGGFQVQAIHRVGRIPPLAKSMVAVAIKP